MIEFERVQTDLSAIKYILQWSNPMKKYAGYNDV